MTVFEAARELGRLITETEQAEACNIAHEKFLLDEEAVRIMQKYEQSQRDIEAKMQMGAMTQEQFAAATSEMQKLGTEVKSHPVAGAYVESINNFNKLMNQIFHIVQSSAWGHDGDACGCGEGCGEGCGDDCGCGGHDERGCSCGCGHSH